MDQTWEQCDKEEWQHKQQLWGESRLCNRFEGYHLELGFVVAVKTVHRGRPFSRQLRLGGYGTGWTDTEHGVPLEEPPEFENCRL